MKRFSQSLTAVAMASALALGGATVAQAQIPDEPGSGIPAPAVITVDGVEYQKQADGTYKSESKFGEAPLELTADQAQAAWEKQQENAGEDNEDTPGEDTQEENSGDQNEGIPAPATKVDKDGNTCYQHIQDKSVYVKDRNKVNEPITDEMRAECVFDETDNGDTTPRLRQEEAGLAGPAGNPDHRWHPLAPG